jgi:hypothetical protein
MKRTQCPPDSFPWGQEILALPGRQRAARLIHPAPLPRPQSASIDRAGYLHWQWPSPPSTRKVPATLCFDFANLAQASDSQIQRFAAKWGPLGLEIGIEQHVKAWRYYARIAQASLRFVTEVVSVPPLRQPAPRLADEDWKTLCEYLGWDIGGHSKLPISWHKSIAAAAVNQWFAQAKGHAILDYRLQIRPCAHRLFGILITQLAHVIARSDQWVVCAGCKRQFSPKRPISRGSRQYCPSCRRKKVPQRDAARDFRARAKRERLGTAETHQ